MIFKISSTKLIEEKKLINRILKGDKFALYFFYQTYHSKLLSFIKKRVKDKSDAEELLQDVFLSGLESLRDFSQKSSLYTYLCAIAKYKIIDYYRKKKITQLFFSHFPALAKLVSKVLSPDDKLIEKELKSEIFQTLKKLKPIYQKIILLKYQEEKTIAQIAKILKISLKSTESLLFRARKKFAKLYVQNKNSKTTSSKTKGNYKPPS